LKFVNTKYTRLPNQLNASIADLLSSLRKIILYSSQHLFLTPEPSSLLLITSGSILDEGA